MGSRSSRRGVLVGVDGTPPGWTALDWAIREAGAHDEHLLICHCRSRHALVGARPIPQQSRQRVPSIAGARSHGRGRTEAAPARGLEMPRTGRAEAIVEEACRRASSLGPDVSVRAEVSDGQPAEVLEVLGATTRVTVLGGRRLSALAELLIGSTALHLVTRGSSPVAIVHQGATGIATGPFAGHVVVGVDGSPASRAALEFAAGEAVRHRTGLAVVHVSDETAADSYVDERLLETHLVPFPQAHQLVEAEVEPVHRQYPTLPIKRAVFHGHPADGLLRAAAGARIVVVGSRRRGEVRSTLGRAVALALTRYASCPTLVVPA